MKRKSFSDVYAKNIKLDIPRREKRGHVEDGPRMISSGCGYSKRRAFKNKIQKITTKLLLRHLVVISPTSLSVCITCCGSTEKCFNNLILII